MGMVSSALDLELDDLRVRLERIRAGSSDDPEYQRLRSTLPERWPI